MKEIRDFEQIYNVWEGYLWKISRADRQGKFSLKTGIFRKYLSQYDISV
jgi:hypothetical protein